MSDRLDRIVASINRVLIKINGGSIKITQKNVIFSYSIKLLKHWGKFQSSYETNKSMENIMRRILEEVIILDRHKSDGQLYLFLHLFSSTEKICLNWRLNSTVTDYVFLIFIAIPLW